MDSKVNYTIVGAFVLVLSALLIFIGFWLSTQGRNKIYDNYLTYARGGVDGLTVKSPIYFNGVRVGYVDDIQLSPSNPQLVKILLKIENDIPVTQSTRATLVPQGITGLVYVGLEAGSPPSNVPIKKMPGYSYPVIRYREPLMAQIGQTLPDITKNIQKVAQSFTQVFNDKNNKSLEDILSNTAKITQNLANNSQKINDSLTALQKVLDNTKAASEHFTTAVSSINQTSLQITKTMKQSQDLVNDIDNQLLPSAYQMMQQLQQVSNNLQDFSSQIAQNPSVILRGKKNGTTDSGNW